MDIPTLKYHKASGQGRVWLNGRYLYCGKWGTDACQAEYDRLIHSWLGTRRNKDRDGVTVNRLVGAYLEHCEREYPRNTVGHSEAVNIAYALKPLLQERGTLPAGLFTPMDLEVVREKMIALGWTRKSINRKVSRVRSCFKWGYTRGLVPQETWKGLEALGPIRRGSKRASEAPAVLPVPVADIEATQAVARRSRTPMVADMIEVLLRSGERAGEMLSMASAHFDRSHGTVWIHTIESHKTWHQTGESKQVVIPPKAVAAIEPYLRMPPDAPIWQNSRGDAWTVQAFRRAVQRYAERAGVPVWHPHQLRHNFGTAVRAAVGLEVASEMLGHSSTSMTEQYAEATPRRVAIAKMLG